MIRTRPGRLYRKMIGRTQDRIPLISTPKYDLRAGTGLYLALLKVHAAPNRANLYLVTPF